MDAFLSQYWPNFAGTVSGALTLSILFFLLKERLFSLPQITGIWEVQLITAKTAYRPYEGLQLWYRVTLIQTGAAFTGVGELDREHSVQQVLEHRKSGRRPIEIRGMIEKRFTKADLIHVLWTEEGVDRKFSNVFVLNVSGSKTCGGLWGRYASTAAESSGWSNWKRLE